MMDLNVAQIQKYPFLRTYFQSVGKKTEHAENRSRSAPISVAQGAAGGGDFRRNCFSKNDVRGETPRLRSWAALAFPVNCRARERSSLHRFVGHSGTILLAPVLKRVARLR